MSLRFGLLAPLLLLWLGVAAASAAQAGESSTLRSVRARGQLLCGVSKAAPGFSQSDGAGRWSGLEVDFCAAIAAAVLGNAKAVSFVPLNADNGFAELNDRSVDVVARATTWTLGEGTKLGAQFVGPLFHRGTALLVQRSQGIASALELTGAAFCLAPGSKTRQHVEAYFGSRKMAFQIPPMKDWSAAVKAYSGGRCQVLAADVETIAAQRRKFDEPGMHMVLPDLIAQESLGPLVRNDSAQWFEIVRWTLFALVRAEELGLARANVDDMRALGIPAARLFLGDDSTIGNELGLDRRWTYRIIKQVGNYGELFARHLGSGSKFKMQRGLNDLWSRNGLLVAPPFR